MPSSVCLPRIANELFLIRRVGLFMSYTVTGVVTQLVKVRNSPVRGTAQLTLQMCVGRPRPDLIARCQPLAGAADRPVYGLSTIDICTSENVLRLADGFKVFPSASMSLLAELTIFRASQADTARVRLGNDLICADAQLTSSLIRWPRLLGLLSRWKDASLGQASSQGRFAQDFRLGRPVGRPS